MGREAPENDGEYESESRDEVHKGGAEHGGAVVDAHEPKHLRREPVSKLEF